MIAGVIVPVRGPAPWLGEALGSVLGQDPAPAEVVVVDDASEPAVEVPGGVRLVRLDAQGGPAAARDAGLGELGTDLIALCDADDVWEPGKLAAQLEALERHPDAAVCFGRAGVIGPDGRPTGERWEEMAPGLHEASEMVPLLYERNPIPSASAVVRRSALVAAGGFAGPAPLASDWDLWLRLAAAGHAFVCEPAARIRYRRHGGGVSADLAATAEAALAIADVHAELVDDRLRQRVRASHLTTLARGEVRRRRYGAARERLAEADALVPAGPRERALRAALAVPGLRAALGRRSPHGRG